MGRTNEGRCLPTPRFRRLGVPVLAPEAGLTPAVPADRSASCRAAGRGEPRSHRFIHDASMSSRHVEPGTSSVVRSSGDERGRHERGRRPREGGTRMHPIRSARRPLEVTWDTAGDVPRVQGSTPGPIPEGTVAILQRAPDRRPPPNRGGPGHSGRRHGDRPLSVPPNRFRDVHVRLGDGVAGGLPCQPEGHELARRRDQLGGDLLLQPRRLTGDWAGAGRDAAGPAVPWPSRRPLASPGCIRGGTSHLEGHRATIRAQDGELRVGDHVPGSRPESLPGRRLRASPGRTRRGCRDPGGGATPWKGARFARRGSGRTCPRRRRSRWSPGTSSPAETRRCSATGRGPPG